MHVFWDYIPNACTMHAMIRVMASPGSDIAETLGFLLQRAARARLYGRLTADLDDALDEATYPVISGLARLGPRSAAQLAEGIGLDRSVVSRHAARLSQAGLLTRLPDPSDRRAVLLTLTEPGHRAVREMRQRLADALDEYLAPWPPGEAQRFAANLRQFAEQGPF
jgi:DNA-binding MarR family transcriptional regulator